MPARHAHDDFLQRELPEDADYLDDAAAAEQAADEFDRDGYALHRANDDLIDEAVGPTVIPLASADFDPCMSHPASVLAVLMHPSTSDAHRRAADAELRAWARCTPSARDYVKDRAADLLAEQRKRLGCDEFGQPVGEEYREAA